MQFKYQAMEADGRMVEEEIDADNVAEVVRHLAARGAKPISVKKVSSFTLKAFGIGERVTLTDQIFLSKYLALMLKIGTGLLQAVNILIEDFDKSSVKSFLVEVRTNLEKGLPFHATFSKHPKIFSQYYVNLVRAGEASGNLEHIFENLTTGLTKEKVLRDQIKSALVYPLLLLVAATGILFFLVSFALPKISKVFLESGFDPPTFSRIVFKIGGFFESYGLFIVGAVVVIGVGLFYASRVSLSLRKFASSLVNEIPVVSELTKKIALQRFASILSSLVRAGLPLTEALEITAETVSQAELKDTLIRISKEGLAKGLTVGEAFKREQFFPRTIVNLIAISEKSGHIEEVLETLADFYLSEIDSSLKSLVSFLEPVMLFGIGGIIGVIALAIIIPIYQLTTSF